MPSTVGLFVRLVAKPGREAEVEVFLKSALPLVQAEPATTAWFAVRLAPSSFAIFDVFPNEAGRDAHLQGQVAAALMQRAPDLLAEAPDIQRIDVLAENLPGSGANYRLAPAWSRCRLASHQWASHRNLDRHTGVIGPSCTGS